MIRYIKLEDSKKRDAEITFKSINSGSSIYLAIETGEKPENKKVIKSSKDKSIKTLIGKENPSQEDYNKFQQAYVMLPLYIQKYHNPLKFYYTC